MKCEVLQNVLSERSKKHPTFPKTYFTEPCSHPAKYRVTYLKGTTGKQTTKLLCGKHYVALKKATAKGLKDGWDNQFSATPL